jgi:hypothetical protein
MTVCMLHGVCGAADVAVVWLLLSRWEPQLEAVLIPWNKEPAETVA